MSEIKHYVVTYTENKQYHEVIWHALSVEDALHSIKENNGYSELNSTV